MIVTKFLAIKDFHLYGDWLRERSDDTLFEYFGVPVSSTFINSLLDGILSNPEEHYFLIATQGNKWAGLIHMARISETDMEFGVMVGEDNRHQGIADELMKQAITWIQNRGFNTLYLHCLNRNSAMKHLATKHGLELHEVYGDIESTTKVPPPSLLTYTQEMLTANKNIFFMNLQNMWAPYADIG
jgi:RimJ/RimL family protein N-acetyltransferase